MNLAGFSVPRALAAQKRNQVPKDEGLEGVQRLAYDPEQWPHCMAADSSRHDG